MILAAEAFASQDHENLKPMLDGAKKNLVTMGKGPDYFEGKELTADSNYHSLNSLTVCKDEKIDAYIPDIQFRKRDPRFAEQERFKEERSKKSLVLSAPLIFLMMKTKRLSLSEWKRIEMPCPQPGQPLSHL